MNINENLNPEIEMLKEESAPEGLKARIVKAVLDDRKSKTMIAKKIIGFGLPAIVVGAIALGAAMAPKTALADPIAQTRDAFEAARNYHMTTYQVVDGQRKRISESWVEDGKRTTYTVDQDGTLTLLHDNLIEVQGTLSVQILDLKPAEVAKGWIVERDKKAITVPDKVVELELAEVYEVQLTAVPDKKVQFSVELDKPAQEVFIVKGDRLVNGETIELALMPFVDAEMSIEALQKLLEDKDLWEIETNQMVNGRLTHKYKLKESYMDFSVFVDPQSKLPILTRQTLHDEENNTSTTTEVEYDYSKTVPPTVAEKPQPEEPSAKN